VANSSGPDVPWGILDSGVYIDHWSGHALTALDEVRRAFVIRHSSVVLSELRRGARTDSARELVDQLFRLARIQWEPTRSDWWRAGKLIRDIGDSQHWNARRRRDFQNDTLIALTAERNGATVITTNRIDFELLAMRLGVRVVVV
jgi:predicted nucleic acid-binding protein